MSTFVASAACCVSAEQHASCSGKGKAHSLPSGHWRMERVPTLKDLMVLDSDSNKHGVSEVMNADYEHSPWHTCSSDHALALNHAEIGNMLVSRRLGCLWQQRLL